MKSFTVSILIVLCSTFGLLHAQEDVQLTSKDSIVASSWMFGIGYNVVDDSGDAFGNLFDVSSQWNALSYPSRLSIGKYFKSGIGFEAIGSHNKYKVGKFIDGATNLEESNYLAIDTRLSYDLNKLIGETAWFDPYVGVGLGYTDANNEPRGTFNAVVGFRTWFSDHWGLDLNSSGKWAMGNDLVTNHLQHAAGVVYRFGIEKELSKKGLEKLEIIEALEKEKQRVQDSIDASNRAKEAAALAERLAREKEQAQLAAAEKARIDAENKRKQQIKDEIDALGHVYFELNSSYLDKKSKKLLDEMASILREYPSLELKVASHTDSRGNSKYNKWLSEKRVNRTVSYLVQKGISESRLISEAYGESELLNECDDNTYCTEEEHQINRRSDFIIAKY